MPCRSGWSRLPCGVWTLGRKGPAGSLKRSSGRGHGFGSCSSGPVMIPFLLDFGPLIHVMRECGCDVTRKGTVARSGKRRKTVDCIWSGGKGKGRCRHGLVQELFPQKLDVSSWSGGEGPASSVSSVLPARLSFEHFCFCLLADEHTGGVSGHRGRLLTWFEFISCVLWYPALTRCEGENCMYDLFAA